MSPNTDRRRSAKTIRVVLADDQAVVLVGFRTLLGLTDDIVVVGEATNGQEAIDVAAATRPDVVVMDVRMPTMDGLEATRRIVADPSLDQVRVLVLTTFELDEYVFEALRAGASGFLLKDLEPEDLYAAIRSIAAGQAALGPSVARLVVDTLMRRPALAAKPELVEALTDRERSVVRLVGHGMSNEEIAAQLFISPLTAKTHVSRALSKLGARDRAQLVVIAYESGLAIPGRPHSE